MTSADARKADYNDLPTKNESTHKNEPIYIPPDGGWGWVVASAAFINTLLLVMVIQAFPILFAKLFDDKNASTTVIAWIFNLTQLSWHGASIFLPSLCVEFGWRKIAFISGMLVGFSTILSSSAETPEFLFFTISILYGTGVGLGLNIFHLIISQYFEKKRGRVIGIVTWALFAGQFVVVLLVRRLQDVYGAQGTILIIGATMLNILVGAMLYQPIEWHRKKVLPSGNNGEQIKIEMETGKHMKEDDIREGRPSLIAQYSRDSLTYGSLVSFSASLVDLHKNRTPSMNSVGQCKENKLPGCLQNIYNIIKLTLANISCLKMARVIIVTFSLSLSFRLSYNMLLLVPLAVVSKGYSLDLAAYCLTVHGIFAAIAVPIVSTLTDVAPISPKWYFMIGCLICSASTFTFTIVSGEVWLLLAMGVYGFGVGGTGCIVTQLIIDVVGLKLLPSTLGAYGFISLFLCPTVGPAIGFIRDVTQDFDFCLRLISLLHLVPFLLWTLMPLATKFDLRIKSNSPSFDE